MPTRARSGMRTGEHAGSFSFQGRQKINMKPSRATCLNLNPDALTQHSAPLEMPLSILQVLLQKITSLLQVLQHSCRYFGLLTAPMNALHAWLKQVNQASCKFRHLQKKQAVQGWLWSHVTSVSHQLQSHMICFACLMPSLNQAQSP